MLPRRRLDVVAVLPQAPVDLVHVLVRRLDEADVERLGVLHPAALAHPDQCQDRSVVIEEDVEVLPAGVRRPHAEVLLEQLARAGNVVDGQVDVVELHPRTPYGDDPHRTV
jgi:hypothetical protein